MQITDLVYIDSTGYHYADYPTFLQWRKDQYRAIFGADVYLESDSQDGQLLAVQAQADFDTAARGATNYNSYSPVTSQGVSLSRNVKINGLSRRIPTHSTVDVLVVGQAGTTITNGVAVDVLNQKWNLPASVTIPGGGSITVTATADDIGAVQAEANTVNSIFTPTRGWQTVNNVAGATAGEPVETDAQLRIRQQQSTSLPAQTVFDATQGVVANLAGVIAVRGYENDTDSTDANTLPPHSISLIVDGGDAVEIANAILLKKTPGTNTYGTTSELVYDAHGMPVTINFYRPTPATIGVHITVSVGQGWSSDYVDEIKAAIAAQITSGRIGDPVLLTKIYAPAYLTPPASDTFDIISLTLNKNGGGYSAANVTLAFNEMAVCDPSTNIVVTVT